MIASFQYFRNLLTGSYLSDFKWQRILYVYVEYSIYLKT